MNTDRTLPLDSYRDAIALDEPVHILRSADWRDRLDNVIKALALRTDQGASLEEKIHALHGILAVYDAHSLPATLVDDIETIACEWNALSEGTDAGALPSISVQYESQYPAGYQTSIWVGDITRLRVDAIVNAANSELLGCRIPNHACIDNAIHSAAGPRLRDDCFAIMDLQASAEPVGTAKITRGYALPSKFVVHTVGPQLRPGSQPDDDQARLLESAYRSCLEVTADVKEIRTIAFCGISTGLFAYPKRQAADIALRTVADWLNAHPGRFDRVIFNLYSEADAAIYEGVLNAWT